VFVEHASRRKRVDSDLGSRIVGGKISGETEHARLRDTVVHGLERHALPILLVDALIRAVETIRGTDVDDAPFPTAFQHRPDACLRHQEHARQVDVQRCIPLIQREVLESSRRDALLQGCRVKLRIEGSRIHEDVDSSKIRAHPGQHRVNRMGIGDITGIGLRAVPSLGQARKYLMRGVGIEVDYRDGCTCLGQHPAEFRAQQSAGTRYDRRPAAQAEFFLDGHRPSSQGATV